MSSRAEIRAVLEQYAAAWAAGDLAGILDLYHDDFTLHYYGTSPLAGTHEGKVAATAILADATARSGRVLEKVVDVLAGDHLGALVVRERLGVGDDTRSVQRVLLYRVEAAKLRECWLHDQDQRFVDQLWASPRH